MKKGQTNQHPFINFTLEEEKKLTPERVFSVRLNNEEAWQLNQIKKLLNIKADSKALKFAAWIGLNVLHGTFGARLLQYMFNPNREKLTDYENFDVAQNIQK